MTGFSRSERVAAKIQQVLSEILNKKVNDPRLELTTITGVTMTRDLKIPRIYFTSPNGKEKEKEILNGFNSATGYVKRTLAKQLGLRYMPALQFYYDNSFDYGSRIENVLKSIKAEHEQDHRTLEKE